MTIRFQAPKGRRFKNVSYYDVTTFNGYWWVDSVARWVPSEEATGPCGTHMYGVRSVRAFRRRLRQWSKYLPSGIEFVLVSRYVGHDVYGKTGSERT